MSVVSQSSMSIEAWLRDERLPETLVEPLEELGAEDAEDLAGLDDEDIEELCKSMKKLQAKKFRKAHAHHFFPVP